MTLKDVREKLGKLAAEIRKMADLVAKEKRDFKPEEKGQWDTLNKEFDEQKALAEKLVRAEQVEKELAAPIPGPLPPGKEDVDGREARAREERETRPEPTEQDHAIALQGWFRHQVGSEVEERHVAAARRCGIRITRPDLDIRLLPVAPRELRALSGVTGSAGAFTKPEGFVNRIELALLQFGAVRSVAEVLRTADGNDMPWPMADDTGNKGVLIAENTAVTEQDVTFAQRVWRAYKYTSKLIRVPVELIEDTAIMLVQILGDMLGERIARITEEHFVKGDGSSKPFGLTARSNLGVTAASAIVIAADELIDLLHSLDPAYRSNARWMMHDSTLKAVRKLKDSQNQYLWAPGLAPGVPDTLLGYPVVIHQEMPIIATGNKSVLFGDFSRYKIRDVGTIRLRRLVERYADTDQEGFVAFSRHDGDLLDAGTRPVKHLVQA